MSIKPSRRVRIATRAATGAALVAVAACSEKLPDGPAASARQGR